MRRSGVLLHPTSLPQGRLGKEAFAFVDFLVEAKCSLWQVLPLTIAGAGNSPYSSCSAMAMDPALIDPTDTGDVDVDAFVAAEPWVSDVALFLSLKDAHQLRPWWEWPDALRDREPGAIEKARNDHAAEIRRHIALQATVARQWKTLKAYAEKSGISIIGDMPIYVDRDSADVWTQRDQFQLDARGIPLAVSGVPPDYFSETGQLWGNPLYDWKRQAEDGHRFWVQRLGRALRETHIVRIDHFRGFSAYWAVPPNAKDARVGSWKTGPKNALFDDLKKALGTLPIIAEDLGSLDEEVHELRRSVGLPGMYVLQFAFGGESNNPYLPHNHSRDGVVYTGTHDNDTTRGFWDSCDEKVKDHVRRYFGINGHDIVWDFIRAALASPANFAIIPAQDLLQLGTSARMNTPSKAEGNWGWRLGSDMLARGVAHRLAALNTLYGR